MERWLAAQRASFCMTVRPGRIGLVTINRATRRVPRQELALTRAIWRAPAIDQAQARCRRNPALEIALSQATAAGPPTAIGYVLERVDAATTIRAALITGVNTPMRAATIGPA